MRTQLATGCLLAIALVLAAPAAVADPVVEARLDPRLDTVSCGSPFPPCPPPLNWYWDCIRYGCPP